MQSSKTKALAQVRTEPLGQQRALKQTLLQEAYLRRSTSQPVSAANRGGLPGNGVAAHSSRKSQGVPGGPLGQRAEQVPKLRFAEKAHRRWPSPPPLMPPALCRSWLLSRHPIAGKGLRIQGSDRVCWL